MAPLLQWLPGESLFSLCSRYHLIAANHTPARTSQLLFGSKRTGSAHDVPANVNSLVSRSDETLGSANEIIIKRSLLPYYFPFHGESRCLQWLNQMSEGTAPHLKIQMGLAASGFGMSHPLKACPECMRSDVLNYGVNYWQVIHQLPGVHTCTHHGHPLIVATDKVSGKDKFGWFLPSQANFEELTPKQDLMDFEPTMSQAAVAMWELPIDFQFNLTLLTNVYRGQFVALDLLDIKSGKYHLPQIENRLGILVQCSGMSSTWPWLATYEGCAILARRLLRMIHQSSPRESRHPLNHLCLILLLFGSWNTFWSTYKGSELEALQVGEISETPPKDSCSSLNNSVNSKREASIMAMQAGCSISSIAKTHGIAVATVMAWAAKEGIASPRRPKLLKQDARIRLLYMLARGADKDQAAAAVGVSIQTITRVLMTEPGLNDLWSEARFVKAQKNARKIWLNTMHAFPEASSVQWRRLEPAAYAWLYRNDRSWLQEAIRSRPTPALVSNFRRDWEQRDVYFSQAIREAALKFSRVNQNKRLTLGELCSNVKGLREKQSVLHKMPRTRTAIQYACSATRATPEISQISLDNPDLH